MLLNIHGTSRELGHKHPEMAQGISVPMANDLNGTPPGGNNGQSNPTGESRLEETPAPEPCQSCTDQDRSWEGIVS